MKCRMDQNVIGASLTSMKVGGPIDYVAYPTSREEVGEIIAFAHQRGLPLKVIGGGSNLLLADAGFRGVLIRANFKQKQFLDSNDVTQIGLGIRSRYAQVEKEGALKLNQKEGVSHTGTIQRVQLGANLAWGEAVAWSLQNNLSGLHWYARIPCQVGGAVYNNIHGERHYLAEVVESVVLHDLVTDTIEEIAGSALEFDYDYSSLHRRNTLIESVIFQLQLVAPEQIVHSRDLYLSWTQAKVGVQPSGANCGSVFQNLSHEQAAAIGQEIVAAGWYIDELGLKGCREGGMQVYLKHANFITNDGTGTQAECLRLIENIRTTVHQRFGVWLQPEVEIWDERGERRQWQ